MLNQTAGVAGLLVSGQNRFVVPTNDIRVQASRHIPWSDPTGMLEVTKLEFEPLENKIHLTITGHVETQPLKIKAVPIPVDVGFVISVVGTLRFERKTGQLFCQVESSRIDSLTPLEGFGVLGELVGKALPVVATGTKNGVASGVKKISAMLPSRAAHEDKPKRNLSKFVPGFAKRVGSAAGVKISTIASSTTSGVSSFASSTSESVSTKIKELMLRAMNTFLQNNPVYTVPDSVNGIPLKNVVQDVQVENGMVIIDLDVTQNDTLRKWWIVGLISGGAGLVTLADYVGLISIF